MPTEATKVRRIVMALDTASSVLPAIEAAAGLALGLHAELAGLFIEDERLLRFAGLPFAREFGFASARARPLAPAAVERALRAAQHLAGRPSASYLDLPGSERGIILQAARSRNLGVLLWPGCIEDLTPAQLSELPCPVVVLN